ncbi:MAG TPA: chloride channel protein, partial [Microlunatus sp.]
SERVDRLPRAARSVPTWLAAISGLVVYRWLPFGQIDFGFRFGPSDAKLSIVNGLLIFLIGAVVAVPIAWALSVVRRAEVATVFRKSPIVIAIAGGVAFALLAVGNPFVLSTGQQGIQHLESLGIGTLLFLTVAKWAGLVIALFTGWRGGPIFPLFFAVAALAGVLSHLFSMPSDLAMIAGIAAVSVVFVRGKLVIGFILTLYAVPIPYTLEILIAGIAASAALSIAGAFGALPAAPTDAAAATPPAAS